ncbi:transmembrane channel-like protein 6 [Nothoprocta perdicaria]|uniref:transmembrane channel-like protein 6 n=1 Tax=Nothoprocta perdicaria TaxID=30464 RepID=UPI000E1C0394|nr:transmembrane channel-like protein 6 [Nothoprocta perdicaria]
MSGPPAVTLHVPEDAESEEQEPSPCSEGAMHSSFRQLIQEQSSLAEAEAAAALELEMRAQGREPPEPWPERGEEHGGFSAATLRVLASMPSRTIGRSRGAIIAQYCNRTARLRQRGGRPSLRQLGLHPDADPAAGTLQEKRSLLAKELLGLSPGQRGRLLRAVPLSLAEKRSLRRELSEQSGSPQDSAQHQAPFSPCKYHLILGCRSLWYGLLSLCPNARPWHGALKRISGRFGSSVLSYFLFLERLLAFNIILFLPLLGFVVALQAAHPPSPAPSPTPFTGLEILTGAGYFTHSLLYYGYYSNTSLPSQPPYALPLAYALTTGACFVLTCVLLLCSMARAFGESYRLGGPAGDAAIKVFCAWDFKVVRRRWAQLQADNIRTQLKELLAEQRSRSGSRSRCRHVAVRLLAWLLALGTVLGCALAVHHVSEHMHAVQQAAGGGRQREAAQLALPLAVTLLSTAVPHVYNALAAWEKHESPVLEVYVAVCRNLLLKSVLLGLLCYQWLSRGGVCSAEACWETCVGQELFRFVVMDLLFALLDTLFGELLWRLLLEKRLKRKQRPEFDIARNVLELIYGQTLTWLGILFSPLLPAVQMLKLLLLFYIKKSSLVQNCQAPSKPWQASHMSTVFLTLLFFPSFLGTAVFCCYAVWSAKPSAACGPFRGSKSIYESGKGWLRSLESSQPALSWFAWIPQHLLESAAFLFLASGALLAVIYFNIQVVKGQRRVIRLLREQIAKEGEDKVFLIQRLHSVYEQDKRRS